MTAIQHEDATPAQRCPAKKFPLAQLLAILTLIFPFAASTQAQAQCSITNATTAISFGSVSVPRDAGVGTRIGPVRTSSGQLSCPENRTSTTSGFYLQYFPKLAAAGTVPNTWSTGTPGVGIQAIAVSYGNLQMSATASPGKNDFAPQTRGNAYSSQYIFSYQLVKTSKNVSGGTIIIPSLFDLRSHNIPSNVTSAPLGTVTVNNTTIVIPTCTAAPTPVTLPDISRQVLARTGNVGGETPFSIGLSCHAGAALHVTFTDASSPTNRTSILSLASGSSATGVGLQLLKPNGSPVFYGADSSAQGNDNQWLIGNTGDISSLKMIARYISTGNPTPGMVRSMATFTLSYQ